jgi:hypothetical protein
MAPCMAWHLREPPLALLEKLLLERSLKTTRIRVLFFAKHLDRDVNKVTAAEWTIGHEAHRTGGVYS